MTFDLDRILASKQARRRDLASRPVAEKLATLDALRDRARAIRAAAARKMFFQASESGRESPAGTKQLRNGSRTPIVAAETAIVPDFPLVNKSFELCYSCTDR